MNREDIVRMAKEAGMESFNICVELDDFAALVASAEREACAAILDANAMACESPILRSLLQSNAQAIRARGQA